MHCLRFVLLLALLGSCHLLFSQSGSTTVTGNVTDPEGIPLIGVTVLEIGTTTGALTDLDGNYSVSVSGADATLQFSYIGYETKTVIVGQRTTIDLTLDVQANSLESIVVVGYGTSRKEDVTGAIASVSEKDFTQGANSNAVQLLNGAAAGVTVSQTSSEPGAGLKIQIRGAGSINSSNGVLFVVDGLPGVSPNDLSPEDIESIDVLKDASAAAIYGTRAANGVVLITTKRGRAGKTSMTYSAYVGHQEVANRLNVLGAGDYANLVNQREPGTYTDDDIAGFGNGTDWQDEIFQSAPVQNHQLSLSGGGEEGTFYVGLNYFDQEGVVKTSGTRKYNVRMNVSTTPFDRLTLSANVNYTRQRYDEIISSTEANESAGPINSALQYDPTLPPGLNDNGRFFQNDFISMDNPLALITGYNEERINTRFYGSINADYRLIEGLTATLRVGARANDGRVDTYRDRSTRIGLANGGGAGVFTDQFSSWLAEGLLTYKRTFNKVHKFSVLGGITFEEFVSTSLGASSNMFLSDVTGTNLLQSGDGDEGDNISSGKSKNQLNGIIGRTTYGYKDKYLLTASVRVDGSSRFADGNKYAVFPSASLGWVLSEEPFLAEAGALDNLKLRVGYGELGNQGIGNFETRSTLVAGGNAVIGGRVVQGVRPARLPNPDLVWETTREVNVGVDFAFADYRFTGSVDFFRRTTSDQLFQKPLPSVVGFSSVRTNLGAVENRGVDISLRSRNIRKENFTWSTNLNLSFLTNEVTELPEFNDTLVFGNIGTFISGFNVITIGQPLASYFGYSIEGIFQDQAQIDGSAQPGARPGEPIFQDTNGDGAITTDDRVVLGNPFPDFTFGLTNNFQIGRLDVEFLILGVQGIQTLDANVVESLYPTNAARNSIARYYEDRWTEENPSNTLPSGVDPSRYGGGRAINSITVVDADFLRLKNLTVGYNFNLRNTNAFQSIRLYAAADNLYTITAFEGFDPDASATGDSYSKINYNSFPLARTYRFGAIVKF